MSSEEIELRIDGETFKGYCVRPSSDASNVPCVLVAPTIRGRSDFEEARARNLVGLGYAALVIDLYGTGKVEEPIETKRARMNVLLDDRPELRRRLLAWLDRARGLPGVDPERVAATGYCFGGLCVLDLARTGADLAGIAAFHAVLRPPDESATSTILSKVLVLHGWDDPLARPDAVLALATELTRKGADWQIHAYGNTLHAFTNPAADNPTAGTHYDAVADRRSWAALRGFLAELFGE